VLHRIRPGLERPNFDVGMPALKSIDDLQPGSRLFGIGREEESQRIAIRGTPGGPRRQRRRAQRAGAK